MTPNHKAQKFGFICQDDLDIITGIDFSTLATSLRLNVDIKNLNEHCIVLIIF